MVLRFNRSLILSCIVLLLIGSLVFLHAPAPVVKDESFGGVITGKLSNETTKAASGTLAPVVKDESFGGVIMGKLSNETAKAALGRATWKLLHTMTLRFPENPTEDESEALRSYLHLTSRLYPCGECAEEFQKLLKEHPPQTASRKAASEWLCDVHNRVNQRLEKGVFDCTKLDDYDCGCGDDQSENETKTEQEHLIQGG